MKVLNTTEIQAVSGAELTALDVGAMLTGGFLASRAFSTYLLKFHLHGSTFDLVGGSVIYPLGSYLCYQAAQYFKSE